MQIVGAACSMSRWKLQTPRLHILCIPQNTHIHIIGLKTHRNTIRQCRSHSFWIQQNSIVHLVGERISRLGAVGNITTWRTKVHTLMYCVQGSLCFGPCSCLQSPFSQHPSPNIIYHPSYWFPGCISQFPLHEMPSFFFPSNQESQRKLLLFWESAAVWPHQGRLSMPPGTPRPPELTILCARTEFTSIKTSQTPNCMLKNQWLSMCLLSTHSKQDEDL